MLLSYGRQVESVLLCSAPSS